MQSLSRVTPDELSSLVMENELLRYEVTHVRARLTAAEKALERSRRDLDELKKSTAADGGDAAAAREDLVWLLTRLDASPLGRVLRRRPRMAELRQRYLPEART